MSSYVVCESQLVPVKDSFPDITYTYIANDSLLGRHNSITNNREKALEFEESKKEDAQFIGDYWGIHVKELI